MAIKRCKSRGCPVFHKREVPYAGKKNAKIAWIGESPGWEEERDGEPFVGDSGKLAKKDCKIAGLTWEEMFVMNSARCRIIKDEMSGKDITKTLAFCRRYVEAAMVALKPRIIVAAGDFALRQILRKSGITKARGRWVWSEEFGCWVYPIFHPAYILRNRGLEKLFINDLREVAAAVKNDYKPLEHTTEDMEYREVQTLKGLFNEEELSEGLGIDTETQGLDWLSPDFTIVSAQFSQRPHTAYDVVLFEECEINEAERTIHVKRVPEGKKKPVDTLVGIRRAENFDLKVLQIRALLESERVKKYMFNGNFDVHVFNRLYRDLGMGHPVIRNYAMDGQAAAHVYDENTFKQASLDTVQRFFSDVKSDYNREFELKYGKSDMIGVPRADRTEYGCSDADVTRQVCVGLKTEFMKPENRKMGAYIGKFVMPTLDGLCKMEEFGAWIQQENIPAALERMQGLMEDERKIVLKNIKKAVKNTPIHKTRGFALTRDDFIRDAVFSKEGWNAPVIKKTKAGAPSIDKDVRKTLLDRKLSKGLRALLEHYDKWSEYHTIYSRYLKGFQRHIKNDGRIHTKYGLTTAVTGRVNSSDPNLMNVPKRNESAPVVRSLIAAPPGKLLLAADEGQSELRWISIIARDMAMMAVFMRGEDIHEATAKALSKKPWDSLSQKERDRLRFQAKAVNFGLIYGMSVKGFISYARLEYGIVLSYDEAAQWVATFFGMYPHLPVYHKRMINHCRKYGWVESPIGRRRRLPEIHSKDQFLRGQAERQAINHPVQAISSDTVLMVNNELMALDMDPNEFMPNLFIHDELIVEVADNSRVEDYAKILKWHMENPPFERDFGIKLPIPLVSDVKVGRNLMEMEKMNLN
jgi:uracil-DNA glycosylase family 4